LGRVLGRFVLAPCLVDERLGVDGALAAVVGDDVRVGAREDLDGVAHLLGDLLEGDALLGEAQAGVGVAEEIGRGVGPADGGRGDGEDAGGAR
jgi:hypothetical protein